jgi:type VI secretion system secreted protein Hcp
MKQQRSDVRVPAATFAAIVVLVLSLFAFADDLGLYAGSPVYPDSAAIVASPTAGETAAFVKFDGVDGESQDRDHKDWINLLSFRQGQFIPSTGAVGSTRGRAGCVFEEVVLAKELDKSSPKLAEAVCKGQVFSKVTIHLTSVSLGGQVYYAYELKNVLVTSYQITGSAAEVRPTEELSLNFEEIKVTYTEYDSSTGRSKGNVEYTWKVEEGQS